ncbi:unnamed protein product [Phyllotreta striolata]|uniref:Peroxisomal biogenesis factor 3 n=1 Tax=Phyllotreta striolata TaxID=444603 RepID=A0A9N9TD21_PHYSR|nr:unnamed protein product [Phyllotreta striolata]
MSVVSKVRGFFYRHKNKFVVGGALISGTILLSKYAQHRLKEWKERETIEFFDRNRKQNHFDSIVKTSNQTFSNFSIALQDLISEIINADDIINQLTKNPENKIELWNNLKVLVFTKVGCLIYSTAMLAIFVKIQLMIIGGYLYKDPNSVPTEVQEKYLSLCQNFLNFGVKKLANIIENEVFKYVGILDLTKQLKLSDIESIYWSVQVSLASNKDGPIEQLRKYILTDDDLPNSSDIYDSMINDTADFLDSDEVKSLATHCINQGFNLLSDQLAEFYTKDNVTSTSDTNDPFTNPFDLTKPLAKLLPLMNRSMGKQSFPQLFVQQLMSNNKLQILSANVYESLL